MKDILTARLNKIGITREKIDLELNREKDVRDFKISLLESRINGEKRLGLLLSLPYDANSKLLSLSIIDRINTNRDSVLLSSYMGTTNLFIGNSFQYKSSSLASEEYANPKRVTSSYISSDLRRIVGDEESRNLNRRDLEDLYARKFLGVENSSMELSVFEVDRGNIYLSTRSEILSEVLKIIHEYSLTRDLKATSISLGSSQDVFIYV